MPTGYTSDIYDGKDISFEDFVLRCSRAFCAFIMQRDEDPAARPRLLEYDPNNHNEQTVKKYRDELARLNAMSDDDIDSAYLEYVRESLDYQYKSEKKRSELRVRYERMLRQVKEWDISNGKTEFLANLKKFMTEQLESSIDFDAKPYKTSIIESAELWHQNEVDSTKRMIASYKKYAQEEKDRIAKQNEMAMELFNALGVPVELTES